MTVYFQNDGVADILALTSLGVSVKESNNPIGFFGTGFKYALATVLRNGGKVSVFLGLKEHSFHLKKIAVRGVEHDYIFMGKQNLMVTTQLGKTWEPWMAFREFYSNMLDEKNGQATSSTECVLAPQRGKTTVSVNGFAQFDEAFFNKDNYFLPAAKKLLAGAFEIRAGGGIGVFYRNVRVGELPRKSLFTYNFMRGQTLTEDRTIKNRDMLPYYIVPSICEMATSDDARDFLKQVLLAPKETYEHGFSFSPEYPMGELFRSVMQELLDSPQKLKVNFSAVEAYRKLTGSTISYMPIELTWQAKQSLETSYREMEALGYSTVRSVPLVVTQELPPGVIGLYNKGTIYISDRAFISGLRSLTGTILEEYYHHVYKFEDETREFQNFLIDTIANCAKELRDLSRE